MQITLSALSTAFGLVVLSLLVRALARRVLRPEEVAGSEASADMVMEAMAGLYGVLLAFLLGGAWDRLDNALAATQVEAGAVANLRQIARILPPPLDVELGAAVEAYRVSEVEALSPSTRLRRSGEVDPRIAHLWRIVASFEPETSAQTQLQAQAIDAVEQLTEQRRLRLATAPRRLHPLLWVVLLTGAAGILGMVAISRPRHRLPGLYLSALATLIAFVLYSIYALSDPVRSGLSSEIMPMPEEIVAPR